MELIAEGVYKTLQKKVILNNINLKLYSGNMQARITKLSKAKDAAKMRKQAEKILERRHQEKTRSDASKKYMKKEEKKQAKKEDMCL